MPDLSKEDITAIVADAAKELVEGVQKENADTIIAIKDSVAEEIKTLSDKVEAKAIHPDSTKDSDVDVKEPEPKFIANSGEYFIQVSKAASDPRAKEDLTKALEVHWAEKAPSGMNTLVSSEGGFLPTAQILSEIQERTYETGQLVADADVMPLGGTNDRLVWNEVVEDDRSTAGAFGGIRAYRVNEGVAATTSQSEFRQRELAVADMMVRVPVTRQLLADSVSLQALINRNAPKAFNKKLDNEIMRGTGAGQALGLIGHTATISIAKEVNQVADTIVLENVEKMYDSIDPDLLTGAKWYINPHARKELRNMTIAVGTGGSSVYIPGGTVEGAPFGQLLGLPVVPTNACSKLGDVGDLMLANMDEYLIVEKGGMEGAESMHVLFNTNEMMYRFTWRVNGMPKLADKITPENANTADRLSAYVTLANRA